MIGSGLLANFGPGFLVAKTHKGCPFMVMVAFQFFALYIYICGNLPQVKRLEPSEYSEYASS